MIACRKLVACSLTQRGTPRLRFRRACDAARRLAPPNTGNANCELLSKIVHTARKNATQRALSAALGLKLTHVHHSTAASAVFRNSSLDVMVSERRFGTVGNARART